ncbi:MAG: type II toxin-antitoxin system HigB family toxin [Acidobacteriota bacterium]|nr:type II toxin-antitoxin system HigB family toxin [Acidobacteriota bacterium]
MFPLWEHRVVRVISDKAIRELGKTHSDALASLDTWRKLTKAAIWTNTAEVRDTFGDADFVGQNVVFNIAHNRYRLIAYISYRGRKVFIKQILTHRDYGKGNWK